MVIVRSTTVVRFHLLIVGRGFISRRMFWLKRLSHGRRDPSRRPLHRLSSLSVAKDLDGEDLLEDDTARDA